MTTIYDETFEAWRREFRSQDLQNLRPDFFNDLAAHIRLLKESQRNLDQKSLKAALLNEELTRLQQLIEQLLDKRTEKILSAARRGVQVPVAPSEKWVLEELTNVARHADRARKDLTEGQAPPISPKRKKGTALVRFVHDVPSIIGADLRARGPFLKEDVASLPWENAESLIRQGAAVEIRTSLQENG